MSNPNLPRINLGMRSNAMRPRPKPQVQDESQQPRLPSSAFTSPAMLGESLPSDPPLPCASSPSLPRRHPDSDGTSESLLFNSLPPLAPGHAASQPLHPETADLAAIMESDDREDEAAVAPQPVQPEAAEEDGEVEEHVKTPPPQKRLSPTWHTQEISDVEEPEVELEEVESQDVDELDSQDLSEGEVPTPTDSPPTPKRTPKTTTGKSSSADSPFRPLTSHPIPSPSKSRIAGSPLKALTQPALISPSTAALFTAGAKKAEAAGRADNTPTKAAPTLPVASPSQDDDDDDDEDNDSMMQGMEYRSKERPIAKLDRHVNSSRTVPRDVKTPEAETEEQSSSQQTGKTKSTNPSVDSRRAPVDGTFLNPPDGTFLNETPLEANGSFHIGGARVGNQPPSNYMAVTPPPHLATFPGGDLTYVSPHRAGSLTYVSPNRAATVPTYVSPVRPSDAPSGPPQASSSKVMPASTPPSPTPVPPAPAIMSSATELQENEGVVEESEEVVMEENEVTNDEPRRRFGGLVSPGGTQAPTSDVGLLDSQSQGLLFGSQTQLEGADDFTATQLQVAQPPPPLRSASHSTSNIPVGRRLSRRSTANGRAQIAKHESPGQGVGGSDLSHMGPPSSLPSGGIHEPTEDTLERAAVPSRAKPLKTYGRSPTKRDRRAAPSPARSTRSDDDDSSLGAEDVRDGTYQQPAETVPDVPFKSDVVEETPATPSPPPPLPQPAKATKPAKNSVAQVRAKHTIPSSGLSRASASRSSSKRKAESPPPEPAGPRAKRGKERAKSPTPAPSVESDLTGPSRAKRATTKTRSPAQSPAHGSAVTSPARTKRGKGKATATATKSPSPAPEPEPESAPAAPTAARAKRGKTKVTSLEPKPAAPAKPRAKKAAAPRTSSTRPDRGKRKVMSPMPELSGSSSSAPEDAEDYTYRPVKKVKTGPTTTAKKEPARAKSASTSARARSTSGRSNRAASTAASTRSSRAASTAEDDSPVRVLALWKQTSAYYAGTITGRKSTGYAVKFDDGHGSTQPLERLRYLHFDVGDTVMGKTVGMEYRGEGDLLCIGENGKESKIKSKSIVVLATDIDEHFDGLMVPAEVLLQRFPPESNGDVFAGKVFVLTAVETPNVAAAEDMKKRIEAHGGTVRQTWEELFDCKTARLIDNTLPPFLISLDNPVITTPKVLAALATGIPIVAPRYVADAIKDPHNTDWRSYLVALESKWLQVPASQVVDPFWGEESWNASTAQAIRRPLEGKNIVFIEGSNKLDKRRRESINVLVPFCLTGLGATVEVERVVPADTSGFDLVMVEDRDAGLPLTKLKKSHGGKLVNVAWMKSGLVVGKALPAEIASD